MSSIDRMGVAFLMFRAAIGDCTLLFGDVALTGSVVLRAGGAARAGIGGCPTTDMVWASLGFGSATSALWLANAAALRNGNGSTAGCRLCSVE